MTTRSKLMAAGAATALLLAASIAIIRVSTDVAATADAPTPAPLPASEVPAQPAIEAAAAPVVAPPGEAAPPTTSPARLDADVHVDGTGTALPVVRRSQPHRLQRGAPAPVSLYRGLNELRTRVARCATKPRPGGTSSGTVLLLEVESLDGKVAIVRASVQSRGGASDAALTCAEREVIGQEIDVPEAEPGTTFELPLAVSL